MVYTVANALLTRELIAKYGERMLHQQSVQMKQSADIEAHLAETKTLTALTNQSVRRLSGAHQSVSTRPLRHVGARRPHKARESNTQAEHHYLVTSSWPDTQETNIQAGHQSTLEGDMLCENPATSDEELGSILDTLPGSYPPDVCQHPSQKSAKHASHIAYSVKCLIPTKSWTSLGAWLAVTVHSRDYSRSTESQDRLLPNESQTLLEIKFCAFNIITMLEIMYRIGRKNLTLGTSLTVSRVLDDSDPIFLALTKHDESAMIEMFRTGRYTPNDQDISHMSLLAVRPNSFISFSVQLTLS